VDLFSDHPPRDYLLLTSHHPSPPISFRVPSTPEEWVLLPMPHAIISSRCHSAENIIAPFVERPHAALLALTDA